MGQYIVIGLATRIVASKKSMRFGFAKEQEYLDEIKKRFNSTDIYSVRDDDEYVYYELKPDVAEAGMIPFLKDFYKLRFAHEFADKVESTDEVIQELSKLNNYDQWIELAESRSVMNFGADYPISYWIRPKGKWEAADVQIECIMLDLTGKAWMECYDDLFWFFTSLIREKLKNHPLAQSLFIYLSE